VLDLTTLYLVSVLLAYVVLRLNGEPPRQALGWALVWCSLLGYAAVWE
jgi:hypothetical protein